MDPVPDTHQDTCGTSFSVQCEEAFSMNIVPSSLRIVFNSFLQEISIVCAQECFSCSVNQKEEMKNSSQQNGEQIQNKLCSG